MTFIGARGRGGSTVPDSEFGIAAEAETGSTEAELGVAAGVTDAEFGIIVLIGHTIVSKYTVSGAIANSIDMLTSALEACHNVVEWVPPELRSRTLESQVLVCKSPLNNSAFCTSNAHS
jgi:hypothetical protein